MAGVPTGVRNGYVLLLDKWLRIEKLRDRTNQRCAMACSILHV